ncbi:hypothetical protein WN55_07332 [Dufourea novaeangliae]|uniref:Uncharacterized protein n=1 Tax=Dufourea novaeangliae TaxID=178035 RepID=A0A154P4V9_DUFNO|nr:hypothetical protein WN55_07332 [Dufourea novaeangliae]
MSMWKELLRTEADFQRLLLTTSSLNEIVKNTKLTESVTSIFITEKTMYRI